MILPEVSIFLYVFGFVGKTVRKRWKSLRDCVVKDLKMRTDNPSYIRRKHNPLVDELQFILPFVKKHG